MPTKPKNPEKLTGPEKVRFLSVLSKDPELQVDVVAHLREIGALTPATLLRLDEMAQKLPAPLQQALSRADDVAEGTLKYVREHHSVQAAKERLAAGARRLGRLDNG